VVGPAKVEEGMKEEEKIDTGVPKKDDAFNKSD
jgi:hypothetical protein